MARYQIAHKASTKEIKIQAYGVAAGSGFTVIGNFYHIADASDAEGNDVSHVLIKHVDDILYKNGILTSQFHTIKAPVSSMTVTSSLDTIDISNGERGYLSVAFVPPFAPNKAVTYVSSDPTKATVDVNGKVTPVAAGSTTITVTNTDSGVTATKALTIQA